MKKFTPVVAAFAVAALTSNAQVIISDDYNVATSGNGFALNAGVNFGINPPTTRLTGTAATDLRYIYTQVTGTPKLTSAYTITGNKIQVARAANSGRFTLSDDGTTPFDFASALGIAGASPANPFIYDVRINMANSLAGGAATTRFSFGLGTTENNVTTWDFGFQLFRANATDTTYTIQKRIDLASSGLLADQDANLATGIGTYGTELSFLMRVTDAGAESGGNFNSRIQLSLDNGANWIYDTDIDGSLLNGWRLDAASRYFIWDQAGAGTGTGAVTYDKVTLIQVPEPSTVALCILGGVALLIRRRRQ